MSRVSLLALLAPLAIACSGSDQAAGRVHGNGDGADAGAPGAGGKGGGPNTAPPTEGGAFLERYARAVCTMYEPCCGEQKLGYDADGCTTWFRKVTAAYFSGEYRADKGEACLAALSTSTSADPERCKNVLVFDEATLRSTCVQAFAPTQRSGKTPGEKCTSASECATSGDDTIVCDGQCYIERRGAAGDGPCFVQGGGAHPERYRCYAEDGLYCNRSDNVCAPQVEAGDFCPFPGACRNGGLCTGGRCVALPGPGEPCANAVPGAGGFCRAGSACNTATLTCSDPLGEGMACREDVQCASRYCRNGKCDKPEFTRALNCTG